MKDMEENHRGLMCPYHAVRCQEGYCSNCTLSPQSRLTSAVTKRNEEWGRLENTFVELIKLHYRLLGKPYYEPTTPELESRIVGRG